MKLFKSGLPVICLLTTLFSSFVRADTIEVAKADVQEAIQMARLFISKSEDCVRSRELVEPGRLQAYAEPCVWSKTVYEDYRNSFEEGLNATGLLLNRGESLLLSGDATGNILIDVSGELFFWDDKVKMQIKRESELLGFCYHSLISTNIVFEKCCDEFKADGLNPPACK